jgi:tetratricopeptide (TPR) repeat protein
VSAAIDPKDKIDEYKILNNLLHDGLLKLRDEDYTASAARFQELSRRGIDSFEAHYYFGQALVNLRRWREAATQFERAIPRLPGFAASYLALAECRTAAGDLTGAIAALRAGERAVPADPRLYEREGATWQRLGDAAEAIRAYTAELRYAEKDPVVRERLAGLHRDAGDLQNAEKYFREAIALDAGDADYWNSLGMVVGARGDLAEAERVFREAIQRDPREPRYTYNLGLTLQREGRVGDAALSFRKTLELNPRFAAARERLLEVGR